MARRAKPRITPAELDRAIGALPFSAFKRLGLDGIAKRFKVRPESVVEWMHRFDGVRAEVQLHLLQNMRPVPFPLLEKLLAARARVGSDNLLRLKWLLAFAQGENKDASDLAVEVFAFAAPSDEPIHEPDLPNESLGELAPEKINDLAKEVRAGINALHAGRGWETRPLSLAIVADGSRSYRGRVADCFLAEAVDLALAERARTRTCGWSECKRLFVKNKRAKYCSRQCSAKARFLRWRDNKFNSDRAAFSLWRHKRYKASHPRAKMRPNNKPST
jgi:hypothetical protein